MQDVNPDGAGKVAGPGLVYFHDQRVEGYAAFDSDFLQRTPEDVFHGYAGAVPGNQDGVFFKGVIIRAHVRFLSLNHDQQISVLKRA